MPQIQINEAAGKPNGNIHPRRGNQPAEAVAEEQQPTQEQQPTPEQSLENKVAGAVLRVRRLHPNATIPQRAHPSDAGFDLFALDNPAFANGAVLAYHTGVAVAIPPGHVGLIRERSSVYQYGLNLIAGVIDAGYTGEIVVLFRRTNVTLPVYTRGNKIAQLLIIPIAQISSIQEVDDLGSTERSTNGFGSTGN